MFVFCSDKAMLASHQAVSLDFLHGIPCAWSHACCDGSWDHLWDAYKTCKYVSPLGDRSNNSFKKQEHIYPPSISKMDLPHQQCKTAPQLFGFLCEDLTTCLPPSLLCDGKLDCSHGEDESATYCGQLPSSLPQNLIFKCPNRKTWTYVDKVCDARNDCGDCSDESVLQCPVFRLEL
ncbi:hypothetical protein MC885_013589 [Smutsia gigantea]|nr:hypothetical protein MC885_013589 [Smutsia gigantea]